MTDRSSRETLAALAESERALSTLLTNLPGVAYRCLNQPGWPMEFLSQGCLELTGYTPEALMVGGELDFGELIHPDDRARIWDEVQAAIDRGEPFTLEYRIHTVDGRERVVWERGRAVYDEAGRLVSLEGFIQDITARVELEARVLEAQKLEAVGQLAGGVVHDINNMLMVIRAFLERGSAAQAAVASEHPPSPAVRAVERGAALTRQLLAIARQQPHQLEVLELGLVLEDFVALNGPLLGKQLQLVLRRSPEPVWVHVDRAQLDQVLMNLCINARDAMPDGGQVELECRADLDATEAVIEVRDTGTGVDPAIQDRIFEPYFSTKPSDRGTGLGLFTAATIVQAHHGRIELDNVPGQGCRFTIRLPLQPR